MSSQTKTGWFDDDDFWIEQYPSMFSDQRFAEAVEQAERLIAVARKPQENPDAERRRTLAVNESQPRLANRSVADKDLPPDPTNKSAFS